MVSYGADMVFMRDAYDTAMTLYDFLFTHIIEV